MRREPLDEALLLGEHRLLPRVGCLAVGFADRALALVEIVVARVARDFAAVDLGNPGDDAVHEVAIVRRHEQRPGPRLEERLEPDDRLDVEVVRRLVHQQDVGFAEQHARHGDAHLPAARQRADVAVDPLVVEPEAMENLARAALERVAAEMVVLLLHLAEALENPVHLVGAPGIFERLLQLLELVMQVADAPAAGDRLVEHRAARHLLDVLAEVADGELLRHRHVAFVRLLFARDHAEERRLARPVRSDEPDLLAGIELKGRVDEEDLATVLLADTGERDHFKGLWARGYGLWAQPGRSARATPTHACRFNCRTRPHRGRAR